MSVALQKPNSRPRSRETQVYAPAAFPLTAPGAPAFIPAAPKRSLKTRATLREERRVALWKMGLFFGTLTLVLCAGFAYLCGPIRLQTEQSRKISLIRQEHQLYEELKQLRFQKNAILAATEENAKRNSMVAIDAKNSISLP